MYFIQTQFLKGKTLSRRISAGLILMIFLLILSLISQPAAAGPLALPSVVDTETQTSAPTNTATSSATTTATGTATNTATASATATATLTPTVSATATQVPSLEVIINEIAWMGTKTNPSSEWIELYNPGNVAINLDGWKLVSKTGGSNFLIDLSGETPGSHSIAAHSYYLLERGDDNAIYDIAADQVYNADALRDDGEYLQLIDKNGNIIDTANRLSGTWPAGNKSTVCSMERAGYNFSDNPSNWITNSGLVIFGKDASKIKTICGTPKNINWAYAVTPTMTRTVTPTRTPILPTLPRTPTKTPKRSPTPTRDPFALPPSSVVINEFLTKPRSDWNGDGRIDSGDEFIEIMNLGTKAISLSGWNLDDQPGDSLPFSIEDISIEPKARLVFFSAQTGILLSNAGDSVRLINSSGKISDAFSFGLNTVPDQSWCRLPDGFGLWHFGCAPTITVSNLLAESVFVGNRAVPAICLSKTLPPGFSLAECDSGGLSNLTSDAWKYGDEYLRYIDEGSDTYILD